MTIGNGRSATPRFGLYAAFPCAFYRPPYRIRGTRSDPLLRDPDRRARRRDHVDRLARIEIDRQAVPGRDLRADRATRGCPRRVTDEQVDRRRHDPDALPTDRVSRVRADLLPRPAGERELQALE